MFKTVVSVSVGELIKLTAFHCRTKIAELEKALEKEREAKERLEGLMEERHMQVSCEYNFTTLTLT